jgi:hypothetical protein
MSRCGRSGGECSGHDVDQEVLYDRGLGEEVGEFADLLLEVLAMLAPTRS